MVEHLVDVEEDPVRFWVGPCDSMDTNGVYEVGGYIRYSCDMYDEQGVKIQRGHGGCVVVYTPEEKQFFLRDHRSFDAAIDKKVIEARWLNQPVSIPNLDVIANRHWISSAHVQRSAFDRVDFE